MTEVAADAPEPAPAPTSTAVQAFKLSADTLGLDMLNVLVQELKMIPVWESMSQDRQNESIARMAVLTKNTVAQALAIVTRGHFPGIPATLTGVSFGKSIKGTLDIGRRAIGRHEFADALGAQVMVVLTNPDAYNARMDEIRAADKQADLFNVDSGVAQSENYTGGDGRPFRRDEPGIGEEPPPQCADTAEATPEPEALWVQAQRALAVHCVVITDEEAQALTERQCIAAMFWCQKMAEDPTNGPLRPKFLPAPTAPPSDDIH